MEWKTEDIYKIINLYQQFPCLWDYRSSQYKRLDQKKNAWEQIAKNMEKSEDAVKKKIKNLRTAYLAEKKKVDSTNKKSGSAAEDLYRPQLYYYSEMSFLQPAVDLRETKSSLSFSNDETEVIQFTPTVDCREEQSLDDSFSLPESSTADSKRRNLKRAKRDEKINSALDSIIAQASEEKETMFSTFGKSIGMQLEKMTLTSAMEAMATIQKVMMEIMQRKDPLETAMIDANLFE